MEGFRAVVKEQLYKPGPVSSVLARAEARTGLDRVLLAGLTITAIGNRFPEDRIDDVQESQMEKEGICRQSPSPPTPSFLNPTNPM